MNTSKIEKAAVFAVRDYLNKIDKFEAFMPENDKAPIIDGYINVFVNKRQKVEDFIAQIPIQVKASSSGDYFFSLERKYVEAYKQIGGIVFFKVFEDKKLLKILYAILSLDLIDNLLLKKTDTINIELKDVPTDLQKFENEIFVFAIKRKDEKVENTYPKEIAKLVEGFEEIRECLGDITDIEVRYELESLLDSIKNTNSDGSIGWRDKFIYYTRKALDLANNNLKGHDFVDLQFQLGKYLHDQKQYHLVEVYYLKALAEYRNRAKVKPDAYNEFVATTLNNLAVLHGKLNLYDKAEAEYAEALKIYKILAKEFPYVYNEDVAMTLNNLATLHQTRELYTKAEREYKDALKIYQDLVKVNPFSYKLFVATALNNLASLHMNNRKFAEAEQEYQEALKIRRELAKVNPEAYIADVAKTLNNLAILHAAMDRFDAAEHEYLEALEIYRELAKKKLIAYMPEEAMTHQNLGNLYQIFSRYEDAMQEYLKAQEIYRKIAKTFSETYRDTFITNEAKNFINLGTLYQTLERYDKAIDYYIKAKDIYEKLAEKIPDILYMDTNLEGNKYYYIDAVKNLEDHVVETQQLLGDLKK